MPHNHREHDEHCHAHHEHRGFRTEGLLEFLQDPHTEYQNASLEDLYQRIVSLAPTITKDLSLEEFGHRSDRLLLLLGLYNHKARGGTVVGMLSDIINY